jgi:transketolase
MRKRFIQNLINLAEQDSNIYLIVGDLGFSFVEPFKEKFSDRFLNVGIAEQNMIGVAAGLAMAGKKVFVYSIIPFITMRCFEQIRLNLCYQNLPVRLIGFGAGFTYGDQGSTHHAIEDIAIMRSLPNMTIVSPANFNELDSLVEQANKLQGPVYFRLSKLASNQDLDFYPKNAQIKLGKTVQIISDDKNLIFTTGDLLTLGLGVCKKLKEFGLDFGLVSVPTIKPLDLEFLISKTAIQSVFTIEEHSVIGGLGETLASFVLQNFDKKIIFKSFGIPDCYYHEVGSRGYLQTHAGLTVEKICSEILQKLSIVQSIPAKNYELNL